MKLSKALSIVLFVLTSCLFSVIPAWADDDEAKSQITPVITVAPNLFPVGQLSDTFVCVSNGNPSSTNGVSGIFTGNIVISDLFRPLPSTIRVCARSQFLPPGTGGYILYPCASSLSSVNNKTDVQPFSGGLELISRLKPVAFKWTADGSRDFGLNAEDVAEIEPALVTRNDKGDVEDVKEGILTVVLINAIKEQQRQIQAQQEQISQQQRQIDALKQLTTSMRSNRPVR